MCIHIYIYIYTYIIIGLPRTSAAGKPGTLPDLVPPGVHACIYIYIYIYTHIYTYNI